MRNLLFLATLAWSVAALAAGGSVESKRSVVGASDGGQEQNNRPATGTFLVNGVAATVGKSLITVQDAYFFRALLRFRAGESNLLQPEEGEDLKRTVRKMVFEEMVLAEMNSLHIEERASSAEIAEALSGGRARSVPRDRQWKGLLSHFGKSESAAYDVVGRSLAVDKFMVRKIETLTPIITQADVERYVKQNETRFRGSDTEKLKPGIVTLLKKERTQKGLEEWLRFLRDKYGVTNYLDG